MHFTASVAKNTTKGIFFKNLFLSIIGIVTMTAVST